VRRLGPGLLLAVFGSAAALLYLGGAVFGSASLVAKPVPVLALAAWVARRSRLPQGRFTAAGLLLAAVGDVLLDAGRFLPGLGAFLLAHVLYILAFLSVESRPALARALPFAAWGIGTFSLLRPGLGTLALPVGAYVVVITIMMWRAAARVGSTRAPGLAPWLGLAGALAFGASDTLIALTRFLQPIEGVRVPIMLLYWFGQWGIAASAALAATATASGAPASEAPTA
jgi:alkenylglycerophosphocholine/alkenylglycerophosphoethanolamine hydrolase